MQRCPISKWQNIFVNVLNEGNGFFGGDGKEGYDPFFCALVPSVMHQLCAEGVTDSTLRLLWWLDTKPTVRKISARLDDGLKRVLRYIHPHHTTTQRKSLRRTPRRDCIVSLAVTVMCYPLEVIQLHMRLGLAETMGDSISRIWSANGFSGFYVGFVANLAKVVPYFLLLHYGRLTCRGLIRWWTSTE